MSWEGVEGRNEEKRARRNHVCVLLLILNIYRGISEPVVGLEVLFWDGVLL